MSTSSTFLGIDVSQDWIDACLLPSGQTWHVATDPASLDAWVASLPQDLSLVVLEATGGLEARLTALLHDHGLPVAVVNPRLIRDFARSLGQLAKTDRLDAAVIARYAQAVQPSPRPLSDPLQETLHELLVRRSQLLAALRAEENRLRRARTPSVRRSLDKHIRWLQSQLENWEREIETLVQSSPLWLEQKERLTSVPGVGDITAHCLLAHLPELGTLNGKEIASLVGVAPFTHESGKWKGHSFIERGRSAVRRALYMAALVAFRFNPVIREFAARLRLKGKPNKVILVACMRKLLVILNAMMRDQTPWHVLEKKT